MMLRGLPDFQNSLTLADGPVWPAFQTQRWLLPAHGVELATTPEGAPAFRLSISRPIAPFMPPPPSAALDLSLTAVRNSQTAFIELRKTHPRAVLTLAYPASGSARLEPTPDTPEVTSELQEPVELIWNGVGRARLYMSLPIESALVVGAMIENGTLPLAAHMALGYEGVSPRVDVEIEFDPAALIRVLEPGIKPEGMALADLSVLIRSSAEALPLEWRSTGNLALGDAFAQTMADRLVARFGESMSGPSGGEPMVRLMSADQVGSGRFRWNLANPVRAVRWIVVQVDPFTAVRDFVAAHGASRLVTRHTVQPIPTGAYTVSAFANLPPDPVGLDALGVTIVAAPALPHRPQAAVASAMITGPEQTATLTLKLAPGEPLIYTSSAFAVVSDSFGVRRLEGPERLVTGPVLRLVPGDFAIRMLSLEAAPDVLAEAELEGDVRYRHLDRDQAIPFTLNASRPLLTLAVPASAENEILTVTAHALDGSGTLSLGSLSAQNTRIEMTSFVEFGPQFVLIRCLPPSSVGVVALDLLADDRPETEIETLAFTAARPERNWSYFARSPFRGGFRWRLHADAGGSSRPWLHRRSAQETLIIDAAILKEVR